MGRRSADPFDRVTSHSFLLMYSLKWKVALFVRSHINVTEQILTPCWLLYVPLCDLHKSRFTAEKVKD